MSFTSGSFSAAGTGGSFSPPAAAAAASGPGPEQHHPSSTGGAGSVSKKDGDNTTKSQQSQPRLTADQRFYSSDETKLQQLKSSKPWMKDPIYFKSVAVSPSAVTKMMMHCASGVSKGVAKGGNPIEVMGLLLGRPDPTHPTTLIVVDAFPLPIEGFETRVVADDQDVVNHMINLTDCLGVTRKEHIMGWYHSHPFDLEPDRSHCFLSQTDLSTQLLWQRAEDPQGNPFVAIVLDPLRSQHLGEPQLKAFRAFPPEYTSPITNQCPDGTVELSEQFRLEHWGSCWNRYYELNVEYYMSSVSRQVLSDLTQNYLWMKGFQRSDESVTKIKALQDVATQLRKSKSAVSDAVTGGATTLGSTGTGGGTDTIPSAALAAAAAAASATTNIPSTAIGGDDMLFPAVSTLQATAANEITQSQLRQIQKQVFQKPTTAAIASSTSSSATSATASASA
jgi:COP9 signalosome complex subunit 5